MADNTAAVPAVYPAIAAVQAAIDAVGIAKGRTASAGGTYQYRGIDDVLNTFSGPLANAKLMVLPNCVAHELGKVKTKNGEIERSIVNVEFTFLSLVDGSMHLIGNFMGEGSDSLDKSLAKAHAVALRTCLLQTFNCPLGPAYDPEAGDEEGPDTNGAPGNKPATAAPIDTQGEQPPRDDGPGDPPPGEVVERCTEGQKKILETALKRKGLTGKDLKTAGFADINRNNYNSAMAWVKQQEAQKNA